MPVFAPDPELVRRALETAIATVELDLQALHDHAEDLADLAVEYGDTGQGGFVSGVHAVASAIVRLSNEHAAAASIERGTLRHRILDVLSGGESLRRAEILAATSTDSTQLSRAFGKLHSAGLAVKRQVGREAYWEATAAGIADLGEHRRYDVEHGEFGRFTEGVRELLQSMGLDAPVGDSPALTRMVLAASVSDDGSETVDIGTRSVVR